MCIFSISTIFEPSEKLEDKLGACQLNCLEYADLWLYTYRGVCIDNIALAMCKRVPERMIHDVNIQSEREEKEEIQANLSVDNQVKRSY